MKFKFGVLWHLSYRPMCFFQEEKLDQLHILLTLWYGLTVSSVIDKKQFWPSDQILKSYILTQLERYI